MTSNTQQIKLWSQLAIWYSYPKMQGICVIANTFARLILELIKSSIVYFISIYIQVRLYSLLAVVNDLYKPQDIAPLILPLP